MTEQERVKEIEKRADDYCFQVPYNGTKEYYDTKAHQCYTDGALSMLPEIEELEKRVQYAERVSFETSKENADLIKRVRELEDGLRDIIKSWDEKLFRQEELKFYQDNSGGFAYWSPSASMVSSQYIAAARKLTMSPDNG